MLVNSYLYCGCVVRLIGSNDLIIHTLGSTGKCVLCGNRITVNGYLFKVIVGCGKYYGSIFTAVFLAVFDSADLGLNVIIYKSLSGDV